MVFVPFDFYLVRFRNGAARAIGQTTHYQAELLNGLTRGDNASNESGPGRIRTFDQWIMSPLLCR